jgi:hypothetical protein
MKHSNAAGSGERPEAETFSHWFHTWRYLFWFLGLVTLSILFYAEEDWRGERAWRIYKERMTAQGECFEASAFIPPRLPDEENFAMAPALSPLFGFVAGTPGWVNSMQPFACYDAASKWVKSKPLPTNNSWIREPADLALWAAAFAAGTNHIERESLLATNFSSHDAAISVLQALTQYAAFFEELRTASRRPHARFNIHYEEDNPEVILLPHLAQIKRYCQILQLRCSAELALGRTEEALNDLLLMLYLADTSRGEPFTISHLVRMAELQLALQPLAEGIGKWSEPQLRALQQHLQEFDFCADIKRTLQAERTLLGTGVIEWVRRSPNKMKLLDELPRTLDVGSGPELWPIGALTAAAPEGWLYLEERNHCRALDQYLLPLIDVTNRLIRPDSVRKAETALNHLGGSTPLSRLLHHQFFASILLPLVSGAAQKTAFAQTAVDFATLACALERYRLAHGQFPDSLQKLSPDLMPTLPHDIINGNPLKYRLDPNGHYVLYSVGWNEKDDGGYSLSKSAETYQKEGDWVWSGNSQSR